MIRTRQEEREYLRRLIASWNASRLDIFEISEPNEVGFDAYGEFHSILLTVFDIVFPFFEDTMLVRTGFALIQLTMFISQDLEYRGVMRFFFQDAGAKMATKCVRVTSVETAEDVTRTLVEKFRPDMKMLSNPNYSLYEVHPNGGKKPLGSAVTELGSRVCGLVSFKSGFPLRWVFSNK